MQQQTNAQYRKKIVIRSDLKALIREPDNIEAAFPCSYLSSSLPVLTGTRQQIATANIVRLYAMMQLLISLDHLPNSEEIPPNSTFGKRLRWARTHFPELDGFLEHVRFCAEASWWLNVAYGAYGEILDADFYKVVNAIEQGIHGIELKLLCENLTSLGREIIKEKTDKTLVLNNFESKFIPALPELKGTSRQIAWARDIRREWLIKGLVTEAKARQIKRAKWWILKQTEPENEPVEAEKAVEPVGARCRCYRRYRGCRGCRGCRDIAQRK